MNILRQKDTAVAIALGSNLGDAAATFARACCLLEASGFEVLRMAGIIVTKPLECPPGTPDFANSALIGEFSGTPEELLDITQHIEVTLGRPADHGFHESRTLDLDIILFGRQKINTPQLTIPHRQAQQRRFVLEPLNEIAPDWVFPDSHLTIRQALEHLNSSDARPDC